MSNHGISPTETGETACSPGRKPLRIWLIQTGETLPLEGSARKMRTAIIADELLRRGHEVVWWGSCFDHFSKKWVWNSDTEVVLDSGLTIIALKGMGYKKNVSPARFIDHRIVSRKFPRRASKRPLPDIIVANMPPHDLAFHVVRFAQAHNIPCIVDVRDPWPDIFVDQAPPALRGIMRALLAHDFRMTGRLMHDATALFTVSKRFMSWALRYAGRPQNQWDEVFYLGARSDLGYSVENNRIARQLDGLQAKFVVTFIGTMSTYHNPEIMLEVADAFAGEDVLFVLAGSGDAFNEIARKAQGKANVLLPGWLTQDEIAALLSVSDVGVCTTPVHADLFPNKAFSYLSAGLPLISAFEGDLAELIDEEKIGFNYRPGDAAAVVAAVRKLRDEPELRERMSVNAHRLFSARMSSEAIYSAYCDRVETTASAHTDK